MTLRTHKVFAHSQSWLSYLQLKLAMKRFHFGAKYGITTESLSYTQICSYSLLARATKFTDQPIEKATLQSPKYVPNLSVLYSNARYSATRIMGRFGNST